MLRVWLALAVGVVALVVSGVVASSMATAQAGAAGDPAAVITAYETARNRRDIDGALAFFTDDATVSQRSTTFAGKDQIRKFLEGISARSRFIVVSDRHSSGNRVTWTERSGAVTTPPQPAQAGPGAGLTGGGYGNSANPNANANTNGQQFAITVEAFVQDGKIHSLTYQSGNTPLRTDPSLEGRAQLPAAIGLGAVVLLLVGVVMVASVGLQPSPIGASSMRGRLMQDLRGWTAARE